jgi:hypothetical protein
MDPSYDTWADVTVDTDVDPAAIADIPTSLDVLPDGRETVVIGDVDGLADYNHKQGDNSAGFEGTCGLVSCEDVLRQFGVDVTEDNIVDHAAGSGECYVGDDPEKSGGTSSESQAQILNDYGVPAHTESGQSLEDLAADVERGSGVIVSANAGYLWDDANAYDSGQSNHAVVVTGVARDPETGELQGFFINDSGTGNSAQFVDASTMQAAYVETGGNAVVTDVVRSGSEDA